ncbi:class I SAM-dependent methyltransferase [Aquimarina sp. TRL1]|uniref:class I SAM-dependent methyltransferase n=1 Tax=Aquimarina sp. (strain TRL1) TaxID=2736252 RepID=UPI001589CFE1|nr:class I SAM-dependent methyltransferase [Aquimarina sp. TRL1]QKX06093.1 class I SAM-dependent methyltransferase [Aquimarina sp. TRL1]
MNKNLSTKKIKKPWPTKDAMQQIYEMNLWGGKRTEFYSGIGSHAPIIITPYIEAITSFLKGFDTPITLCDLGCGDFNVGKMLVPFTKQYIAVDIVPDLIERNKREFADENVTFYCMDIALDELPAGDCAILRQVLQHLSNTEIQQILEKLYAYKYVIITEHLPEENIEPNKDIISGQGIRLKKQSGVNVLAPPFTMKVKEKKELVSVASPTHKGVIVTHCYQLF